jgi:RNA polymerase sigma-70 factor (sigma-E family)
MWSRRGSRDEFDRFAEAEGPGLFRLAYSVCGDRERAEDAVQEAFAQVYPRWSRLREPLAYARRVTVNGTRDAWRRDSRQDQASAALERQPQQDPIVPQDLVVEWSALGGALAEVPHDQRVVVVLRYGSQLTEAETATVLGIPVNTVKTRCRRGLMRLREVLSSPAASRCTTTATTGRQG